MDIGRKVKELRQKRKMTQAQLAADRITRNMLSRIEHNQVTPSLTTLLYLAERLRVPAGYLLAEAEEEFDFEKSAAMAEIRLAFRKEDFALCAQLCRKMGERGRLDDEAALFCAESLYRLGEEDFFAGRMRRAADNLDEALRQADATVHDTRTIRSMAQLYFRMMHSVSSALVSKYEEDEPGRLSRQKGENPLALYAGAMEAIRDGRIRQVQDYLSSREDEENGYVMHVQAHLSLYENDYPEAKGILEQILNEREKVPPFLMHQVLSDLEFCCREMKDYKGAYEYSQEKLALAERFLSKEPDADTES